MSFSFTANSATPDQVKQLVDDQAAANPNLTEAFAAAVKEQVDAVPTNSRISFSCYGHTGWGENQVGGEISLHFAMQVEVSPNE